MRSETPFDEPGDNRDAANAADATNTANAADAANTANTANATDAADEALERQLTAALEAADGQQARFHLRQGLQLLKALDDCRQ